MGIAAAQTQRRKSPTHRASEASRPPFSRRPSAQTSLQRSNRRRQPIRSLRSFGFPAISDWNRPKTAHRSNRRPRIPYEVRERRGSPTAPKNWCSPQTLRLPRQVSASRPGLRGPRFRRQALASRRRSAATRKLRSAKGRVSLRANVRSETVIAKGLLPPAKQRRWAL